MKKNKNINVFQKIIILSYILAGFFNYCLKVVCKFVNMKIFIEDLKYTWKKII